MHEEMSESVSNDVDLFSHIHIEFIYYDTECNTKLWLRVYQTMANNVKEMNRER